MLQGFSIKKGSWVLSEKNKLHLAAGFAVLMHVVGLTGILYFNRPLFVSLTPVNLLLMPLIILPFAAAGHRRLMIFFILCFIAGWLSEWIGVQTGLLFGNYTYGTVLGFKPWGVPLLIGLNWFMVVYCSAAWVKEWTRRIGLEKLFVFKGIWVILPEVIFSLAAAIMTVVFDFFLEPVAVNLGYWKWLGDGNVPVNNYLCWFLLSFLFLIAGRLLRIDLSNRMAAFLFTIQLIFFIILGLTLN